MLCGQIKSCALINARRVPGLMQTRGKLEGEDVLSGLWRRFCKTSGRALARREAQKTLRKKTLRRMWDIRSFGACLRAHEMGRGLNSERIRTGQKYRARGLCCRLGSAVLRHLLVYFKK